MDTSWRHTLRPRRMPTRTSARSAERKGWEVGQLGRSPSAASLCALRAHQKSAQVPKYCELTGNLLLQQEVPLLIPKHPIRRAMPIDEHLNINDDFLAHINAALYRRRSHVR